MYFYRAVKTRRHFLMSRLGDTVRQTYHTNPITLTGGSKKEMKRTLISTRTALLFALVLVLCLAVTIALTVQSQAEAQVTEPQTVIQSASIPNGTEHEVNSLDSLRQVISSATSGDTIKLAANIGNITETITFSGDNKELTLDLNGHKLTGNGTCDIITINAGTVTLIDSSASDEENTGTITGGTRGIYVAQSSAKFVMQGGTITGNAGANGSGVKVDYGAFFEMIDGTINANMVFGSGGGVWVGNQATFKMTGGMITNNSATLYGGGVHVSTNGTFEMSEGVISENRAKMGGGVSLLYEGANFKFDGGTIYRNTAPYGGGVFAGQSATFTMTNGAIDHNSASGYAGGVRLQSGATFTMDGGEITNNSSAGTCGGVYVNGASAEFIMNGGVISGNSALSNAGGVYIFSAGSEGAGIFTMTGGTIINNYSGYQAGGVMVRAAGRADVNISGNSVIKDNFDVNGAKSNLRLESNQRITISSALTDEAEIWVQTNSNSNTFAFTSGYSGSAVKYFFSDDVNKCLRYNNGELQVCKHELTYSTSYSNSAEHWKQCQYCGEKTTAESHAVSGNWTASSENHTAKCDVCQATVTAVHTLGEYLSDGDGKHYQECAICDYATEHEAHVAGELQCDASAHWQECTLCNTRFDFVAHDWHSIGFTANGETHTATCSDCGQTSTEEHNLVLKQDDVGYWQECKYCSHKTDKTAFPTTSVAPDPSNPNPSNPDPGNPTPSNPTPGNPTPSDPTPAKESWFDTHPLPLGYALVALGAMLLVILVLAYAARKPKEKK